MALQRTITAYSREEILQILDPAVAKWFSCFKELTPPQKYAIASINGAKSTLISSPTGSGKTLGAFLAIINELVMLQRKSLLEDRVYCVYVSPLGSLDNDIAKNLSEPLKKIQSNLSEESPNLELKQIRIAVRTGDTPEKERRRMLLKPPHILITTPETLAIILVAPKFRDELKKVRWVAVDEIHEICASKRGTHLSLTLERLEAISQGKLVRIGLSATMSPLEEVAAFLVGVEKDGSPRDCEIVEVQSRKRANLLVCSPSRDLVHQKFESLADIMYKDVKDVIERNKSTLVFANTRAWAERIAFNLAKDGKVYPDSTAAHHGSLSREHRLAIEERLKLGKMKAVVSSTSLELGLDIGSIDAIFQVGSPKSITKCVQRMGRSGHSLNREGRGVLFAFDQDELVELAVICREIKNGNLDKIQIPKGALDVLAQHIVGMSVEKKWQVKEAFELIRGSLCYRDLDLDSLRRVIRFLAGRYSHLENYGFHGRIRYDEKSDTFEKKGWITRVIYSMNIGTTPDRASLKVISRIGGSFIGEVDEEFAERLRCGDVFVLGGKTYKMRYLRGFNLYVEPADSERPTVPAWTGEMVSLSFELAEAISRFKFEILGMLESGKTEDEVLRYLASSCDCDESASVAILSYSKAQRYFLRYTGLIGNIGACDILLENYIDSENKQSLVFSCTLGRRVNEALGRVVGERIAEKRHGDLIFASSDHGFMITLPPGVYLQPALAAKMLNPTKMRESLIFALRRSELLRRRFRHCSSRSLMILRNRLDKEVSAKTQQFNSHILLGLCERLDRFPIVEEAYREIVEDSMDIKNAEKVAGEIAQGKRKIVICPRQKVLSPFSHNLFARGSSDIAQMSEKRETISLLYDELMEKVSNSPLT
jgi:ATP-dependent Lhr-like helicase